MTLTKLAFIMKSRKYHLIPMVVLATGVILLVTAVSFQAYKMVAHAQLNKMEYKASGLEIDDTKHEALYPGDLIDPLDWDNPRITDIREKGVDPVEQFWYGKNEGITQAGPPRSIEIPTIGLSSEVKSLTIQNYGNARGWETPKNVVGHIPTTANPGQEGIAYLFGHLNSPVRGQGSVFRDLTKIPHILRQGKEVYVYVKDEDGKTYLYRVNKTTVIPQEEFKIKDSKSSLIELVACVPAYIYDHRLIVTAELVGFK